MHELGLSNKWLAMSIVVAGLSACTGSILDPDDDDKGKSATSPDGVTNPAYATTGLRRLTAVQYQNSVTDLLGQVSIPELPPDGAPLEGFELSSVSATSSTIALYATSRYDLVARSIAAEVFADAARAETLVGCVPSSAPDACVTSFLERFGLRAWRRPLDSDELSRYGAIVGEGIAQFGSPWMGLEYATAAFLQSPNFLYRDELGEVDPSDATRRVLGPYALATRLSYLIWNSTPDQSLLDAASSGALATPAGVREQAERLLASPRSEPALLGFFSEWLGLDQLDLLDKDPYVYPSFTATLGASMRSELEQLIQRVVFEQDRDVLDLLDTRETFVDAELAALYGLGAPLEGGFFATSFAEDSPRSGILTRAGLLALGARATRTSPTLRGVYILERLLCQEIDPPPPGVETNPPETSGTAHVTMRDWLEQHRTDPTCAGCHSQMDPPGLALEHFDGIGTYRETDEDLPIIATGEIDGIAFDGGVELAAVLKQNPRVSACVVKQLYRHALGQHEHDEQAAHLDALTRAFRENGRRFRPLILALVQSEAFRFAGGLR